MSTIRTLRLALSLDPAAYKPEVSGKRIILSESFDSTLHLVSYIKMTIKIKGGQYSTDTLHVSCSSDKFSPNENYAGLCLWAYDNKGQFSLNGHKMRTGYIVICKSGPIINGIQDQVGQVHGKCFYKFFNQPLDKTRVLVTGFAYMPSRGGFVFRSVSCNGVHNNYEAKADIKTGITKAVLNFWNTGNQVDFKNIFS